MGARQVDRRDNGHTAKSYGSPLGIECAARGRRALLPLDRLLGNLDGDMRPLLGWPFECSACGSRDVSLWLFAKRAEADGWANVATASGPSF
jgi:hypothetical protein